MTPRRRTTNVAAFVRARLLDLAHRQGATLFKLWSDERRRAAWDLDLLGHGASSVDDVVAAVRDLCRVGSDDGIVFDPDSVTGEEIRAPDTRGGVMEFGGE